MTNGGSVFKIDGSEPGYPNLLESTGYDIDLTTGEGKGCGYERDAWL